MTKKEENKGLTELEKTVKRLKQKHSVVYTLKIPRNDEGTEHAIGFVRKPTRQELAPIVPQLTTNPLGAMEILLNTVWLEGDEDIKTDDELFFGAISSLEPLIKFRVAELKKN